MIRRYHALDALRAVMMLLGVVLHSAVNGTRIIPDFGRAFSRYTSSVC